jgi:hypothetical protein
MRTTEVSLTNGEVRLRSNGIDVVPELIAVDVDLCAVVRVDCRVGHRNSDRVVDSGRDVQSERGPEPAVSTCGESLNERGTNR